jgi:type VI secretion system protein ImpG
VDIAFVDLDFNPVAPQTRTARVVVTCINRDLPSRLPFGGGQPHLKLSTGTPAVGRIECVTAPTRTLRPPLRGAALWRLVSHLNLNHLSLSGGEEGARALREILALYDFKDSAETRSRIDSIVAIRSQPGTARLIFEESLDAGKPPVRRSVMTRGVDIELELSDQPISSSGAYLFAMVLEKFFAHYCTLNAFTRVTAKVRNQEGVLARWPARNGDRVLV